MSQPVKGVVKCASTRVELREVDVLELVCVEPVGSEKHWKEEYNVRVTPKCFPKAENLRLPRRVLHEDDSRPITTYDVLGVNQGPR